MLSLAHFADPVAPLAVQNPLFVEYFRPGLFDLYAKKNACFIKKVRTAKKSGGLGEVLRSCAKRSGADTRAIACTRRPPPICRAGARVCHLMRYCEEMLSFSITRRIVSASMPLMESSFTYLANSM